MGPWLRSSSVAGTAEASLDAPGDCGVVRPQGALPAPGEPGSANGFPLPDLAAAEVVGGKAKAAQG
ncbi:hypothetical protein GCM10020254_52370 [Streptomyces goshikiensis]